jgi:hypothetical protein
MSRLFNNQSILDLKPFQLNKKAFESLCLNEKAIDFLKKNMNDYIINNIIDWYSICSNPGMIPLIEDNFN